MTAPATPIRVFLDANVLFAASINPSGGSAKLWTLPGIRLVTNEYAAKEAWMNLASPRTPDGRTRLIKLLDEVEIQSWNPSDPMLALPVTLPDEDDVPILAGAIGSGCQYLLTLDSDCFGAFFGRSVAGVAILKPGRFLHLFNV